MLTDKLRDGAHGKVFKILFWVIILSFIFTGVGNYLIPKLDTDPVSVGDIKITREQWDSQYHDQVRMMQNQYGAQVNQYLENADHVKALRLQILEDMIDNVSLNLQCYKQNIRIGDEQVKKAIRNERAFFKDGKFNNDLFLATVRNMGSSPDYYAQQLRTSLAAQTLAVPVVSSNSIVYPYEVDALSKLFTEQRVTDIYTPDYAAIAKDVEVSDADAKKFYDEHHDSFMKQANVDFTYILLSLDKLKKEVPLDEAKIEEYYNFNSSDFTVPQKRECSQILIKSGTKDFEKKAAEALTELTSGKSFEEVGAKFSDDPNFAKEHGSLGLLEKGALSKELDIALFSIKNVGGYSKVVIDNYGAHILKLDGITESFIPKLADIKEEVKARYIDATAREMYANKSNTLTDVSYENPDSLEAASKAIGEPIEQSGVVSLGDKSLKWPLSTDEVQRLAFNEENRSSHINTNVVNIGNENCIVLNVSSYNDAQLQKFDDVKAKALELAKAKAIDDKAQTLLDGIKADVKAGKEVTLPKDVTVAKAVTVNRGDKAFSPYFVLNVFAIPNAENQSSISHDNGKLKLAVLKEVKQDETADAAQYAKIIRSQLVQFKRKKADSMLFLGAREISDISYNESAINVVIQQEKSAE